MLKISLKAARVNSKMRQVDVASMMKINRSTLINWESGKTFPDSLQLSKLCEIYKIPIDNIFLCES